MVKTEHIYPRTWGTLALILEAVFLFLILIYMGLEVRLLMRMGFSAYFLRFWGVYDWFNFVLFWAASGSRFHGMALAGKMPFPPDSKIFVNYEPPAYYIVQWKNILAVNAFITWMKMFKYISHIPFMTHLIKVVFAALPDTIGFIFAMFFVFFGFSLSHYLAHGDEVDGFQTLNNTFLTLYRQMLGDFPTVDGQDQSNRLLGPAFFVAWTAMATILLLNMFIAIVIDGFEKVRSEVEKIGFLHFMNNQALPPFQAALKKLQKMASNDDDDDDNEEDDDGGADAGREV
jgi:polycystin 2